jgi:uncharacterized membrane protein YkgB
MNTKQATAFKKFSLRWFLYFFILFWFPEPYLYFPLGTLYPSWLSKITEWVLQPTRFLENEIWNNFIPWIGKHILHLKKDITVFTNGSGDTTYDYIKFFTIIVISFLLAILWWSIDKKFKNYDRFKYWTNVIVRFFLATMLFSYGYSKMFHIQMPGPDLARLLQPYGDSSPMRITWTFLGLSKGYSFFIGFSEVLAGILLLFRKTSLLGALLSILVMFNVFIINMCFDVPVKIFSFQLTMLGVYLAWPYFKHLYNLFILHKNEVLVKEQQILFSKKWKVFFKVIKILAVIDLAFFIGYNEYKNIDKYGDGVKKNALYGIYDTKHFVVNKDTILPLNTDSTRWDFIFFDNRNNEDVVCGVNTMTKKRLRFDVVIDSLQKQNITLTDMQDSLIQYKFKVEKLDSVQYVFKGVFGKDSIKIWTKKRDLKNFRLINTPFRWINEYPYNR